MKNMDLFGKTFECTCGRTHTIEPREVVYADDALAQLPAVCARATDGRNVAMLMDVRTRAAAGAAAAEALAGAGWDVNVLLVEDPPGGGSPICDDHTMEALAPRLGAPRLVVPVGGGVMNDLGKWIAMDHDLPYVAVATAASMNGYASSNIAPTVEGVKRLVYGRAPRAIVACPSVLADAPHELTASGLGDVLAKSVSSTDWRLNHLLFGDYYCDRSVALIAQIEPLYFDRPEDVRDGKPAAMEALFDALLLTGVAMTMAETSSPASGGEHLIGRDRHGPGVGTLPPCAGDRVARVCRAD